MTEPDTAASPLQFRRFREFLVRQVLRRYGYGPLASSPAPGPAHARAAVSNESGGGLLRSVCDVWSIPLGDLAGRAGLGQTVVSSYVIGVSSPDEGQIRAMSSALVDIISERVGVPRGDLFPPYDT